MSSGKMSPRQKMINMMYLVLIALLAMNVSKEILKAFHLMEVSFDNTGASLNSKMKASISSIQAEVKKQGPILQFLRHPRLLEKNTAVKSLILICLPRTSLQTMFG